MKRIFILLLFVPVFAFGESLYSPTWGFYIDPPEGYEFTEGDGRDRFSFSGPLDLMLDFVVYNGRYSSMQEMINDVNRRLSNSGDCDFFKYRDKQAAIFKLNFNGNDGWAVAVELDPQSGSDVRPILLALAYGPSSRSGLDLFHFSALDSICPTFADKYYPGLIMEYSHPRGQAKNTPLVIPGLSAMIYENDAEAAQVLIDREYFILLAYWDTPYLQDASVRFYRSIFRDSFDRIQEPVSVIARHLGVNSVFTEEHKRTFSQNVLTFVQNFDYERDLNGSDFINLVTAVTEGRGDCDSRAMLFSIILDHANIRSAIMVSYYYSHAMGLADISGAGARFNAEGTQWLVAETTAYIDIGLIDQDQSNPQNWFIVRFH